MNMSYKEEWRFYKAKIKKYKNEISELKDQISISKRNFDKALAEKEKHKAKILSAKEDIARFDQIVDKKVNK